MNKKGFTLIELVIVIVILGILAATVAPKFMNLQGDAKKAVIKSLHGAIKSSMIMVKAKWIMLDNATIDNVTMDDGEVVKVYSYKSPYTHVYYSTLYGYPELSADGLPKAVDYDDKKISVQADTSAPMTWIRFYYNDTSETLVNTDESTGCGIFCKIETVSINGQTRYKIKCYENTGGCN